jgi:hypothetical protein
MAFVCVYRTRAAAGIGSACGLGATFLLQKQSGSWHRERLRRGRKPNPGPPGVGFLCKTTAGDACEAPAAPAQARPRAPGSRLAMHHAPRIMGLLCPLAPPYWGYCARVCSSVHRTNLGFLTTTIRNHITKANKSYSLGFERIDLRKRLWRTYIPNPIR